MRATVSKGRTTLPSWISRVRARIESFASLPTTTIKQLPMTEYEIGAGIGWHREKPQFDKVFGLLLFLACEFRFRRKVGEKWDRFTLEAEPRSLYMMTGESRTTWQHSIPSVEAVAILHYTPDYGAAELIHTAGSDSTAARIKDTIRSCSGGTE